jgi:putative transposase
MAWRINKVEIQREDFITACMENVQTFSDLCIEFGISRKTGYKWLERFNGEGINGLKDRSRARHTQALKTTEEQIEEILNLKIKYSKWGPKKIAAILKQIDSSKSWPSATTIGKILDEHNLIMPRKYRRRFPAKDTTLSHCQKPNDVWCIDFKGWFKTKDNVKCDPLTITDAHSRYILYCRKLGMNNSDEVWEVLEKVFHENGLPWYLRHDNGPPFATNGAGRLSRLSIKLIKAGITPEWIEPGKPYQNGRHERMHLTLKQEGIYPLKLSINEQQMKFMEFQHYFNTERPHEGLGQRTPSSVYLPSDRVWKGKLCAPEYCDGYETKRVRMSGEIGWGGKAIFIGKALKEEYVGLKENEDGNWNVYYGPVLLGIIDEENKLIQPKQETRKINKYKERIY